jgi:hypothetical protein
VEGFRRLGLPYLRIGIVVAVAASILTLGVVGPHTGSRVAPTPTATATPAASPAAPISVPAATPDVEGLGALGRYQPAAANVLTSWLPDNITSGSLTAVGTRLFFVVDTNTLESTGVGSGAKSRTLATVGSCQAIAQVAASGNVLAWVVTEPESAAPGVTGCGHPASVAWTIWTADLAGGHRRRIASGARMVDTSQTRQHPVRIALTPTTIAFDRHNSPGTISQGETVEVRRLSDLRLLWSVRTSGRVTDLMLGGDTVAVMEDNGGTELDVADAVNPALFPIARPASSAALSEDGRYLSWDLAPDPATGTPARLMMLTLPWGLRDPISTSSPSPGGQVNPLRPTVSAGAAGPIVAWYATVAGGIVYPAFRDDTHAAGAVISSVVAPVWMSLHGSILVLVSIDRHGSGNIATAFDLSQKGFAGP